MDKLSELLCEVFQIKREDFSNDLKMKDVDGWDSLTHMDLVSSIETEFQIELTMEDIMNMRDISTIYKIVESRVT